MEEYVEPNTKIQHTGLNDNENSWIQDAIRSSSESAHKSLIAYIGVAAYCTLTLTSITDRDLLLNSGVMLPVLNISVSLERFAIAGPILVFILFLYMHSGVINLADLFYRGKKANISESISHSFINRFLSHQLRLSKPGFLEQVQFPIFILCLYFSLPLMISLFATTYAKIRHDILSNLLILCLVASILLSGMVYLAIVDPRFEKTKKQIVSNWKMFLLVILVTSFPFKIFEIQLGVAFYFGFYIYPILLFILILVTVVQMIQAKKVIAVFYSTAPFFLLWILMVALTITSALILDSDLPGTLFPLWIGIAIIGGGWTWFLRKPIKNIRVLTLVALSSIMVNSILGLFRDTAAGYTLNLDVSYQDFVAPETESALGSTASINLSNRNFLAANMSYTTLSRVHFRNSVVENVDFQGAILNKSDFTDANLYSTNLTNATLQGAVFYKTNLQQARFEDADLSGARVHNSNLSFAYMKGAKLEGAQFIGSDLSETRDLTVDQLIKVGTLLYSKLPPNIEQQVTELRPDLVFHEDYGLSLNLPEKLMFSHYVGDTVSRTALQNDLVSLTWEAEQFPEWKKKAYVEYYSNRSISILIENGYLHKLSNDDFLILER